MIKYFLYFLVPVIFINSSFSQSNLLNEKVEGNKYTLSIELESSPYNLINKNGNTFISFSNDVGEFSNSNLILPSKDVFIAIPFGENPQVKVLVAKQNEINGEPELRPIAERQNDSTVVYSARKNINQIPPKIDYEVKGFLWLNNNYSVHIQLNQYVYDFESRSVFENAEYKIELSFDRNLQMSNDKNVEEISPLIINKSFASSNKTNREFEINLNNDWIDFSKTYVKLGTAKDAIYRLGYDDLGNIGVPVASIDPRTFSIIKEGNEIPIFVSGEDDGQFDDTDFVEFAGIRNMGGKHREVSEYGQPYNEYLGRYTDTTIYWLTWGGDNGKRVELVNNVPPAADTLFYYNEIKHAETNNWFDFSMSDLVRRETPFWWENKTWNEGNLNIGSLSKGLAVTDSYPNKPVKFFAKLQSLSSAVTNNAHLLSISLNNSLVQDSGYINKYDKKVLKGELSSSVLISGNNTIKVFLYNTGNVVNRCIFDWAELEYPRYLKAVSDSLNFSFPFLSSEDNHLIKLTNITTNDFSLWKYGDSFKKFNIGRIGSEVLFSDTVNSESKFIINGSAKIKKPKIYYQKQFEDLSALSNQADYIAITHKNFIPKTIEHSQFISSNYNVSTKVVDIDDIYDQFSYGFFNPEAIRGFLQSTHANWQKPLPKYVALIGGATYDYHGNKTRYQGLPPVINYVPSFGASVSDNWFVTWDTTGAYVPQMNIGRIPVRTLAELDYYFNKHSNYVQQPYDDWNKKYLFFSGGSTSDPNQLDQLREVNNIVINNYVEPAPIGGTATHFYKTVSPPSNFGPYTPQEIQAAINESGIFISYIGHSGTQTWDNSITEPGQLRNNKNRNPLITDFGCSTARFGEPDITSFSQLFLLDPSGQAISYIGNSSLGFLSTSTVFPNIFYRKLLVDSIYNVSEALKLSKLEMLQIYGSSGVYQLFALTNTLIGDPIVSLPIPPKPNLNIAIAGVNLNSQPSDNMDSVLISISYLNLGKVLPDSFTIKIEDTWQDSVIYSKIIRAKLPRFNSELNINIPSKNKSGEHKLKVVLDDLNELDELAENDNSVTYIFNVNSSALRTLFSYSNEKSIKNSLIFLNPSNRPLSESFVSEFSEEPDFNNPLIMNMNLDTLYTELDLSSLSVNNRYWLRERISGSDTYGKVQSFVVNSGYDYLLNDSYSLADAEFNNAKFNDGYIQLDTSTIQIEALSAGFYDGKTAIISANSQNLIPENTLGGHHICLFDANTFQFLSYHIFDSYQTPNFAANYGNFLDTLSSDVIAVISVSDEGRVSNAALREKIKTLGSLYIDSLVFRGSWAIIGRKGAAPGSVPEAFTKPFGGRVEIDTAISIANQNGALLTSAIGPTSVWENLKVDQNLSSNSDIKYRPIGITKEGVEDTLDYLALQDSIADLSFIDGRTYPYLKINAEFSTGDGGVSPSLSSLGVNYKAVPELGTNYQVISVSKDSIIAGDSLSLEFYVYNIGETPADSFNVTVGIIEPDNSKEIIYNSFVASLDTFSREKFNVAYTSGNQWGNASFDISIDPDNKILELYKDNNSYQVPFYIKQDTTITSVTEATLAVKFDGIEILEGEYISPKPEIIIELKYPTWFPIEDTSAVEFLMDNNRIDYSSLNITYDTVNRKIIYKYYPTLSDGDHVLRVYGQNILGNLEDNPGYEKLFLISNEMRIMDIYNYPNPFKDNTHFTFKLTQVPDEIRILIYTVAGRLIKEIKKNSTELFFDFNKILWDGKDEDGDIIANGTYLYKIIAKQGDRVENVTEKLVVLK